MADASVKDWLAEKSRPALLPSTARPDEIVASKMPSNAEQEMKQRGGFYGKAWLPFVSNVVVDGLMVTGQNPWSAKATAEQVAVLL
ncbi:hypothetical protein QTI66_33115 [Variovorax sp. J22R133]|uniref:hypothetical protein n=1 Tax=Variovorax brevis TaxID=3053503 RepID=UPI0025775987|nr:hypothetical protein [Variovorax sp. J22R133]MDM0116967.1 hypothetical protein [Variovorax sp. J22R133]